MELYIDKDNERFQTEKDELMKKHKKARLELLEPTKIEQENVTNIIIKFIKENKRKIYGGFALNLLIKQKNKKDAFYDDSEIHDIDFYSPEPVFDVIKICNELFKEKFKRIRTTEAVHKETYTLKVNNISYCDISYMPKQIYNILPTKIIDGFYITHPHFLEIDYLRMINDPLVSYWRLGEKLFSRLFLLQKHYPLPHVSLNMPEFKTNNQETINDILDWLKNKKSIITLGQYAFNYFLVKSGLLKTNFKILPISICEFISINYRDDVVDLLKLLQSKYENITLTEHYPFFQFIGYSSYIYQDNVLIAKIYEHNNYCYPYLDISFYEFEKDNFRKMKGTIRIGTFILTLMYSLMCMTKAMVDKDQSIMNFYTIMSSQLVEMRRYFLNKNKKTIFDDTDFKEFDIKCIGEEKIPEVQKAERIEKRKKKGIIGKMLTFSYDPEDGLREPESNYNYSNISGNAIKHEKKMKIK